MATFPDKPAEDEFDPWFRGYIERAEPGDAVAQMKRQRDEVSTLFGGFDDARAEFRPAPGEWTIKEVFGHLCDSERVFGYRALRFARGDETPVQPFDQDLYVANAASNLRPLADLLEEFRLLRNATILMFRSMDAAAAGRSGISGGVPLSVRALAFIIPGHVWTHMDWLRRDFPELRGE